MPPRDDEFELEDASIGFAKQQGGGRACLAVPADMPRFRPEKGKSYDLILVPFLTTELVSRFSDECRNARPGKWYYEQSFLVHQKIGVNNETHTCPARTFNKPCPVCEDVRRLNQSPHKQDKEDAIAKKPKNRQLFLPFDLNDPGKGVQWWEEAQWNFGRHLKEFIAGARKADYDSYMQFYHPTRGYELRVTAAERPIGGKREGDKGGTNTEYIVNGFYPMREPIPEHILNHGHDLSAFVKCLDYKTLKDVYEGTVAADARDQPSANGHADRRGADGEPFGQRVYGPGQRQAETRRAEEAPARAADPEPAPRRAAREEPAPRVEPDLPAFSKGDQVTFAYRGETHTGEIVRLDTTNEMAGVQVEGFDRPHNVAFADLKPAEQPEPAPRQRSRAAAPAVDAEPPPARRPAAAPASAPAAAGGWDDDEVPPPRPPATRAPAPPADDDDDGRSFKRNTRAAATPPADEPAPAPRSRARAKPADADPEPAPARAPRKAAAPADGADEDPPARKRR